MGEEPIVGLHVQVSTYSLFQATADVMEVSDSASHGMLGQLKAGRDVLEQGIHIKYYMYMYVHRSVR